MENKEVWRKVYNELYVSFLKDGYSSNEADRRALLLVDEKILEMAAKYSDNSKENHSCPK